MFFHLNPCGNSADVETVIVSVVAPMARLMSTRAYRKRIRCFELVRPLCRLRLGKDGLCVTVAMRLASFLGLASSGGSCSLSSSQVTPNSSYGAVRMRLAYDCARVKLSAMLLDRERDRLSSRLPSSQASHFDVSLKRIGVSVQPVCKEQRAIILWNTRARVAERSRTT